MKTLTPFAIMLMIPEVLRKPCFCSFLCSASAPASAPTSAPASAPASAPRPMFLPLLLLLILLLLLPLFLPLFLLLLYFRFAFALISTPKSAPYSLMLHTWWSLSSTSVWPSTTASPRWLADPVGKPADLGEGMEKLLQGREEASASLVSTLWVNYVPFHKQILSLLFVVILTAVGSHTDCK